MENTCVRKTTAKIERLLITKDVTIKRHDAIRLITSKILLVSLLFAVERKLSFKLCETF